MKTNLMKNQCNYSHVESKYGLTYIFFNVFFYQELHVKEKYQIFVILQDLYDKKHSEFFSPYLIIISPYSSQW